MANWTTDVPNINQINYTYPVDECCDFVISYLRDRNCYVWQIVGDETIVSTDALGKGAFFASEDAVRSMKDFALSACSCLSQRDIKRVPSINTMSGDFQPDEIYPIPNPKLGINGQMAYYLLRAATDLFRI